jgi:predicted nucleotide-binding protein
MFSGQDWAQVCLNGHLITATFMADGGDVENPGFCGSCGASSIVKCQHCPRAIEGQFIPDTSTGFTPIHFVPPAYCGGCGAPFPWTEVTREVSSELPLEREGSSDYDARMTEGRAHAVSVMLAKQQTSLAELEHELRERRRSFEDAYERLDRWATRTGKLIESELGADERRKFELAGSGTMHAHEIRTFAEIAGRYGGFLQALAEDVEAHPADWFRLRQEEAGAESRPVVPLTREVFVIHGHDEGNVRLLDELLRERWGLSATILRDQPGLGRTIIEKFEDEAARASYAIALLTPDDVVETSDGGYEQPRPNVVFELGWFFGRLGRSRVCILFKEGTRLHSDLDGISRVQFPERVDQAVPGLEKELRAAGFVDG